MIDYVVVDDKAEEDSGRAIVNAVASVLERSPMGVYSSGRDLFENNSDRNCTLAIIDYRLDGEDGVSVAQSVIARNGLLGILFISDVPSQFEPERYLDPRMTTRRNIRVLEKPTSVDQDWMDSELRPALNSLTDGLRGTQSDTADVTETTSPQQMPKISSITAEEFHSAKFEDRMEMIEEAQDFASDQIAQIFDETDAEWLLVAANTQSVAKWGRPDEPEPEEAHITFIENRFVSPCYLVRRAVRVEDIGPAEGDRTNTTNTWRSCEAHFGSKSRDDLYPTLTLEIDGWSKQIHFDTGSFGSFVSYEEIRQNTTLDIRDTDSRWSPMDIIRGPQQRRSRPAVLRKKMPVELSSLDGTRDFEADFYVVHTWNNCGLARKCKVGLCADSMKIDEHTYWCGSRSGLLGRDLLKLPGIVIILDGARKRAYVAPPDFGSLETGRLSGLTDWDRFE